jgi:shikimate dehydrogenase
MLHKSFSTTDLAAAVGGIRALDIRGCAISMPFTGSGDPDARRAGRVGGGDRQRQHDRQRWRAADRYNTDYAAVVELVADIDRATPFVLRGSGKLPRRYMAALRDRVSRTAPSSRATKRGAGTGPLYGFSWASELGEARRCRHQRHADRHDRAAMRMTWPFEAMIADADIAFDVV